MVYNTLPNRVLISNTFNISELFTFEINQMILQMSIVPKKKSGCRKFKLLQYEIYIIAV